MKVLNARLFFMMAFALGLSLVFCRGGIFHSSNENPIQQSIQYSIGIELEYPGRDSSSFFLRINPTEVIMLDSNGDTIPPEKEIQNIFPSDDSSPNLKTKKVEEEKLQVNNRP